MAKTGSPIKTIIRYAYKPPWWLPEGAQIDWDVIQHDDEDAYVIRGTYYDGHGTGADWRVAEDRVSAQELRAVSTDASVIDLLLYKMRSVLTALRPSTPTDHMIDLALQAVQSADALAVLTDALLEDGTLTPLPESVWSTPAMARDYLVQQARQWAIRHVEERWSEEP